MTLPCALGSIPQHSLLPGRRARTEERHRHLRSAKYFPSCHAAADTLRGDASSEPESVRKARTEGAGARSEERRGEGRRGEEGEDRRGKARQGEERRGEERRGEEMKKKRRGEESKRSREEDTRRVDRAGWRNQTS
eukprot:750274-Hanusia_phi.AAC.1